MLILASFLLSPRDPAAGGPGLPEIGLSRRGFLKLKRGSEAQPAEGDLFSSTPLPGRTKGFCPDGAFASRSGLLVLQAPHKPLPAFLCRRRSLGPGWGRGRGQAAQGGREALVPLSHALLCPPIQPRALPPTGQTPGSHGAGTLPPGLWRMWSGS